MRHRHFRQSALDCTEQIADILSIYPRENLEYDPQSLYLYNLFFLAMSSALFFSQFIIKIKDKMSS